MSKPNEHTPSPEELQIEKDHLAALDHIRGVYDMGVQALRTERDRALEAADAIYEARLRQARSGAHSAAQVDWENERRKWWTEDHDYGSGRLYPR